MLPFRGRPWYLACFLVVAALVACGRTHTADYVTGPAADIDETPLHPVPLHGEIVITYPSIGSAGALALQDSLLWIGDGSGEPFIHLINTRRGTVVRSFGRLGDGPGDFKSIFGFTQRPGDTGAVWGYDVTGHRLTRIADDSRAVPRVISTRSRSHAMDWLGRDRILMITPTDTARFALLDSVGEVLRYARGPLLGGDSVSSPARLTESLQVKTCVRPGGGIFAVVYMDGGRAELYDTTLQRIQELPVPFPSAGVFRRNEQTGIWEARAPRMYYVSCAATATYIYAVFSGRHGDLEHHVIQANSRYIHVFDWTGRFVRTFVLDHDAMSIAVDGDSLLYGVSWGSDTVHKYRIPASAVASGN